MQPARIRDSVFQSVNPVLLDKLLNAEFVADLRRYVKTTDGSRREFKVGDVLFQVSQRTQR